MTTERFLPLVTIKEEKLFSIRQVVLSPQPNSHIEKQACLRNLTWSRSDVSNGDGELLFLSNFVNNKMRNCVFCMTVVLKISQNGLHIFYSEGRTGVLL